MRTAQRKIVHGLTVAMGFWGRLDFGALRVALLGIVAIPVAAPHVSGQTCCIVQEAYRLEYDTTYEQRQVTAFRVDYETVYDQQKVITQRPQWVTETKERRYVVQRQLPETSYRDEQAVTWEPTITYRPHTVDHGQWVDQVVCRPGRVTNRLRWVRGGCVQDPVTGVAAYRPGGLYWVPVQGPAQVETQRVWIPNLVTVQVPQTTYAQKVETRRVPVTTYRVVAEERVEQVPVQVCRMVPVEETVTVPRVVEKRTPVTYTYCVPKTVVRRVPIVPSVCYQVGYVMPCPTCPAPAPCCGPAAVPTPSEGASSQGSGDAASTRPSLPPNQPAPRDEAI